MKCETRVTGRGFSLSARQCIFFVGLRMQEHRKIFTDRHETLCTHLLGRCTDHHMITVFDWQSEQRITHRATDDIGFHRR